MKTFIAAIVLLAITAALIVSNVIFVNRTTDKMLSLCDVFPADVGDFDERYEEISTAAEKIFVLWDKCFERFSLTIGFDNIDRVDDAVAELYAAAKNRDGEAFIPAAIKFGDSLRRLRRLENFNFGSIF